MHFAAGASTATVTIASLTDAVVEGPETVALTLGTASSGGSIDAAHKTGTGTITDTTGAPVYSIADAGSVGEGGSLSFTVSRTTTGTAEDVTYTLGGTATSGSDYTAPTGTVHFAAGASTATVTIASLTDAVVEGPETVALTLGTASSGGSIDAAHKTGTGTITDTTGAPVYSIADAGSVGEGGSLSFTVSRTTTGTAEDVTYTLGGTATSGSDYTAPTGTVHFAGRRLDRHRYHRQPDRCRGGGTGDGGADARHRQLRRQHRCRPQDRHRHHHRYRE